MLARFSLASGALSTVLACGATTPPTETAAAVEVDPAPTPQHGSMSKTVIRHVIRARIGEFRSCYEAQLDEDPDTTGRVVVQFIIQRDGRVGQRNVTHSDLSNELDECVLRVAGDLVFPAPEGGGFIVVNYPFVFRTSD